MDALEKIGWSKYTNEECVTYVKGHNIIDYYFNIGKVTLQTEVNDWAILDYKDIIALAEVIKREEK